jgi:hypothetical protein
METKKKHIKLNMNSSGILFLLLMCYLFGGMSILKAQDNNESNVTNQMWLDLNTKYRISPKFVLWNRIGARTISPHVWNKYFASAEVTYSIPQFLFQNLKRHERVYAGFDFNFIDFKESPNVIELSPYQGYSLAWPNRRSLMVRHMAELGQRFQWAMDGTDYSFGLKMSYEAYIMYKLQGKFIEFNEGFYVTGSIKFWWNLISTTVFNDVVRLTPGLGYEFSPKWKAAFLIGYNYTRNLTSDEFSTNNVIYRFRVYFTIK